MAVELAASAGLILDPWEAAILEDSLALRPDYRWAAFEVAVIVPRQNGKGSILEARELAGLFLLEESLILHSAHEFKTSREAFLRILSLIENTDELRKLCKKPRTSHGEEGIELLNGNRLRFVARSTGSGRGFTGDVVVLDEAYNLSAEAMAALMPTMSARPNPQLWYTSSAPLVTSPVLRKLCRRGRAGASPDLAYFEYCAERGVMLDDPRAWKAANPALGIRISEEFIARELEALENEEFARERLGIWAEDETDAVIAREDWEALVDKDSRLEDPVTFAIDTTPERSHTAIAAAGVRSDGLLHGEVIDHRAGVGWVVDRVVELVERWEPDAVVLDPRAAAGSLQASLEERDIEVTAVSTQELVQACGAFYDDVVNERFRHLNTPELNRAVFGAKKRVIGDAWAWHRKDSDVDISPLVAVTLARWAAAAAEEDPQPLAALV
jgi:phage terminase large subunit-like protein